MNVECAAARDRPDTRNSKDGNATKALRTLLLIGAPTRLEYAHGRGHYAVEGYPLRDGLSAALGDGN